MPLGPSQPGGRNRVNMLCANLGCKRKGPGPVSGTSSRHTSNGSAGPLYEAWNQSGTTRLRVKKRQARQPSCLPAFFNGRYRMGLTAYGRLGENHLWSSRPTSAPRLEPDRAAESNGKWAVQDWPALRFAVLGRLGEELLWSSRPASAPRLEPDRAAESNGTVGGGRLTELRSVVSAKTISGLRNPLRRLGSNPTGGCVQLLSGRYRIRTCDLLGVNQAL